MPVATKVTYIVHSKKIYAYFIFKGATEDARQEAASIIAAAKAETASIIAAARKRADAIIAEAKGTTNAPGTVVAAAPAESKFTVLKYHNAYKGENIAAGYPNPKAAMEGWMHSPGHRANILNPNFTKIGIGYVYEPNSSYGHYWTQLFLSRDY